MNDDNSKCVGCFATIRSVAMSSFSSGLLGAIAIFDSDTTDMNRFILSLLAVGFILLAYRNYRRIDKGVDA